MPIFEYHCTKCDKDFEILVYGDQEVCCPTCKATKVKKLLSTFSHKSDSGFTSSQGSPAARAAPLVARAVVPRHKGAARERPLYLPSPSTNGLHCLLSTFSKSTTTSRSLRTELTK